MRRQRRRKMEGSVNEQKQGEGEVVLAVKVMTDEQIGELRKQIAVYAIISEQLVQMYNNFCAQYLTAAGRLLNFSLNLYLAQHVYIFAISILNSYAIS